MVLAAMRPMFEPSHGGQLDSINSRLVLLAGHLKDLPRGVAPASSRRPCSGMTLIEMLVVIAIVGILASLLLPATSQALERARRTVCQNNLRQTYLMVASHASDHGGLLPAAWVVHPGQPMQMIANSAFGESNPKSLHCPSDRRQFEPPLYDLSYYWNAQTLGQPLLSLHPQLHLATEKWFWHDRKSPQQVGESSTYQGQGVALWADGSTHYQYLGLSTLTNEIETLDE